jgi:hypothetical protein
MYTFFYFRQLEENVMKKRYVIIIGTMLLLTALHASTAISEKENTTPSEGKMPITTFYQDVLDQNQSEIIEGVIVPIGRLSIEGNIFTIQVAQSFIPTKELLTRVELFTGKNVTTSYPLVVGIRDNLTHENLVETSVPPEAFVTGNFSWVECNFDDIWVTPGQTYYIVTSTKNVTDNWYVWAGNNNSDAYPNGCAWYSIDNGSTWNQSVAQNQQQQNNVELQRSAPRGADNTTGDMCFRTYGLQVAILTITTGGTFFKPSVFVKNVGNTTTLNVEWQVTITGGIFHMMNKTTNGTHPELAPGDTIPIPISMLGLGPLIITVKAHAVNAQEVSIIKNAVLLLIFILWK